MTPLLGPHGAATVVLFKAQFVTDLPKKSDIKRLLKISDMTYYKSSGRASRSIELLERSLSIARANSVKRFDRDSIFSSTDYAVMHAGVASNLFMQLKYASELVEGFNITTKSLEQVDTLIRAFDNTLYVQASYREWTTTAARNIEMLQKCEVTDDSVTKAPLAQWQGEAALYGQEAIRQARAAVSQWVDAHVWPSIVPAKKQAGALLPETAEQA